MAFMMLDQAAIDHLTNIFAEGAKRMRQAAEDVDRLGEKIRAQLAEKEVDGNWQPAGAYPVDGTIIEVEGRGEMRFGRRRLISSNDFVAGWQIMFRGAAWSEWLACEPPTGRWRKAPPVRA